MYELFIKGGILMYPLLFLSVVGVAVLIDKFIYFSLMLRHLKRPIPELIDKGPSVLKPIIEGIQKGYDEKELGIIGTKQLRKIETGLSWLELTASVAPLLGLTGTVLGMIKVFQVIAARTHVNPSMLAGGIWEALITTAAGLLVAIPIQMGHHYLERKADTIALTLKETVMHIIKHTNGRNSQQIEK
jgi:biopolymer transport protein ExbB